MTDNELTGRELAVACARAMGWHRNEYGGWYRPDGAWRFHDADGVPMVSVDEALAWLHERGDIDIEMTKLRGCEVKLWLRAGAGFVVQRARASTLTEALQRLVVAVAKRGAGVRP